MNSSRPRAEFVANAENILDAAEAVLRKNGELSDLSILIAEDGAIHMVAESDWALECLRMQHGARLAYRVRQESDRVRVEGRAGARTCLFEAAKPDRAARLLLDNRAWYPVTLPARPLLTA